MTALSGERSLRLRTWGLVVLVLILGTTFSAAAFFAIRARDRELVRLDFEHKARAQTAALELAIKQGLDAVEDVGALFDSMQQVSRAQFRDFARHQLASNPALQGLIWMPLVKAAQRAAYERAARETIPDYQFTELDRELKVSAAAGRAEYFPIYYLESRSPQGAPMGYDHASNPSRLEALARSRDGGEIVATGRLPALGDSVSHRASFAVFRPVYRKDWPRDSAQQRHHALVGFTAAVIVVGDLIANVLERFQHDGINITLYDISAPQSEQLLGVWPADARREPVDAAGSTSMRYSTAFDVAGRHWVAMLVPHNTLAGMTTSVRAWGVLLAGLLFTLLLAAYLEAEQRNTQLMREQAITDALTGLYNRRYLLELLPREVARAKRYRVSLAAVMLDMDHFKRVNDTLGHQAGDAVLREVGALLKSSVRESDVACRYGGEEFLLILPEASLEDVQRRAETLRLAVAGMRPVHRGRPIEGLTISIGIALFPDHADDPESLLRCTDQALYQAKATGRNAVVACSPSPSARPAPAERPVLCDLARNSEPNPAG